MLRLRDLIANSEDWLMDRVLEHFKTYGYVKYSSTLKEAWRISIAGMSGTIFKVLGGSDQPPALGPNLNHSSDPMARFGILEARKHRKRGVSLGMFLGGLKCYRQGYIDLVRQAGFTRDYEEHCRLFVERVFDRVEIAFCGEWTDTAQNDLVEELQTCNRSITNEKNKYLTICESLPNPVIVFDQNNQIESMNYAAMALFGGNCIPGQYYYTKQNINISILWLTDALKFFTTSNNKKTSLEKKLVTKEATCFFDLKFKPLLDISEKSIGTIVILNDITEIKRVERALRNRVELEKTISDISTSLINLAPNEVNKAINDALQIIGKFAGVDRSYIFIFSDDRMTIENTHEWCNEGVTPQISNLTDLPVSTFPWLMNKFERFETVSIPVVADLPPQACQEKETFQAQDIKSLIIVPLVYAGDLVGLVGFDSVFEERIWHAEAIAPLKIVGEMLINVIKRYKSEQAAQLAYKELNQIFTTAGDGMRVIDRNFNVVRVNDAFVALTGMSGEEAVGTKCYDLFYGSHCNTVDCPMFRIIGGEERVESDVVKEKNDGTKILCIVTATPLRSTGGKLIGIVENFKDITERKLKEEKLRYLSFHDPLTGLYNRAYFEQEMQKLENGHRHPVGIIICDVDDLKLVNDNLGHCAGDQTLVAAASVLKQSFRENDVVARIGGDEFAILLPNSDSDTVEKACCRVKDALANCNPRLSMSVGFAVSNAQAVSLDDILKEADNNMYREKLCRKGGIIPSSSLSNRA